MKILSRLFAALYRAYKKAVQPVRARPAFRHGVSREDILHALKTRIYTEAMEGPPERWAAVAFNRAGNPLEIIYNPVDDNAIIVFHAMKARKSFLKMLGI